MAENIPSTSAESHAYISTDQESTDSKGSHESSGRKLFNKLMELCKELENNKEMEIIIKRLRKKFDECSSAYRRSPNCCKLMEEKIATIKKWPEHKFLHLKNINDELKANKKKTKSKSEKRDNSSSAENPEKSIPSEDHLPNRTNSGAKDNVAEASSATVESNSISKSNSNAAANSESSETSSYLEKNSEASSSKVGNPPILDSKAEKSNFKEGSSKKHGNENGKTQRLISKIEKTISKLNQRIQELEKEEIDVDALTDDEDSAYIQKSKYENRICELYKQLCKLKKEPVDQKNSKSIRFSGTKYSDIDRAVEKFYNRKKEFPNFPDIMKVVQAVNSEKNLKFDNEKIHQVAKEAFKELGNQLKRIRQYELHAHITGFLTDAELTEMDPAKNDKELERKLAENKKMYQNKMDEVINVYAEKQNEINVEAILEEDAEIVERGATSPTVSSHEDDSEAETENGIENEIEEAGREFSDEDTDEENEEMEMEEGITEEDGQEDKIENESENSENMNEDADSVADIAMDRTEDLNQENHEPENEEFEKLKHRNPENLANQELDNGNRSELENDTVMADVINKNTNCNESENTLKCDLETGTVANDTLLKNIDSKTDNSCSTFVSPESQETEKVNSPENPTITAEESEETKFHLPVLTDEDVSDDKDFIEPHIEALCMEVDEESESEGYASSEADDKMLESNFQSGKEKPDSNSIFKKQVQVGSEVNTLLESDTSSKDSIIDTIEKSTLEVKNSSLANEKNKRKRTHQVECCLVEQDSFIAIKKTLKKLKSIPEVVSEDPVDSPKDPSIKIIEEDTKDPSIKIIEEDTKDPSIKIIKEDTKDPSIKIIEEDIFIASSSGSIFLSPNKKKTIVHVSAEPKEKDSKLNTCQQLMQLDVCLRDESEEKANLAINPMMPNSLVEKSSLFVVSSCGSTFVVPRKAKSHPTDNIVSSQSDSTDEPNSSTLNPSLSSNSVALGQSRCTNETNIFNKYKDILKDCRVKLECCDDLAAKYERRRKRRLQPIQTIAVSIASSSDSDESTSDLKKVVSSRKKRRNSSSSDSDFDPYASGSKKKKKKRRNSRHQLQAMQLFRFDKQAAADDSDDIIVLDEVPPKKKGSEEIVVEPDTNSLLGIINSGPSRSNYQFNAQNYPKQRGNISITPIINVQRPIRNLVPKAPVRAATPIRLPVNNARFKSPIRPLVQMKRPNTVTPSAQTLASQNYRPNVSRYQLIRPAFQQNMSQMRTLPRGGSVQQQRSFQTNARQFNGANGNFLQKQSVATYQMRHTAPQQTTTSVINNRNVQVVTKTVTQVKTVVQQQRISQQTISTASNQNRLAISNTQRRKQQVIPRNNVKISRVPEDVITID